MTDTIPLILQNCPASFRSTVRHAIGMLSATRPESCPSWAGARNPVIVLDQEVMFTPDTGPRTAGRFRALLEALDAQLLMRASSLKGPILVSAAYPRIYRFG
jgi:hypothetical protein